MQHDIWLWPLSSRSPELGRRINGLWADTLTGELQATVNALRHQRNELAEELVVLESRAADKEIAALAKYEAVARSLRVVTLALEVEKAALRGTRAYLRGQRNRQSETEVRLTAGQKGLILLGWAGFGLLMWYALSGSG